MSLNVPGLPRISNVVGPIPFTNGQSGAFQIMTNLPISNFAHGVSPIQVTSYDGNLTTGISVWNFGTFFNGVDTSTSIFSMTLMLSAVSTVTNYLPSFVLLGFVPPCAASIKSGFFIENENLYYLDDCTIAQPYPTNNLVGLVGANLEGNTILLFGYANSELIQQPTFFTAYPVPAASSLISGAVNFSLPVTFLSPDFGILLPVLYQFFYNPSSQMNYFNARFQVEAPTAVPSLNIGTIIQTWGSSISGIQFIYDIPTPGALGSNISARTSDFAFTEFTYLPNSNISSMAFAFMFNPIELTLLAYEFHTPNLQNPEVFLRNGGINISVFYTPAQYYSFDYSSVFYNGSRNSSDVLPFFDKIESGLFGENALFAYQNSTNIFFIDGDNNPLLAFGYTAIPTAVTGNVFNDLAYYNMIYNPGFEPGFTGYTPLADAIVSSLCLSGATPQYIPSSDSDNPNTIYCEILVMVTTGTATITGETTATLDAMVNANGGAPVTVRFEYSTNPTLSSGVFDASGFPSQVYNSIITNVTANIVNLSAETTYYYRVLGTIIDGTVKYGDILSFTTQAETITTEAATLTSETTATLAGVVNANGGSDVTTSFEYSTDSNFISNVITVPGVPLTASGSFNVAIQADISGLSIETLYYYRAVGKVSDIIEYGATLSFSIILATVITDVGTVLTESTALLTGTINANGGSDVISKFEYSTDPALEIDLITVDGVPLAVTGSTDTSISAIISDLLPETLYYYRLKGTISDGVVEYGTTLSFSIVLATLTTGDATVLSESAAFLTGEVNANGGSDAITSFEYSVNPDLSSPVITVPGVPVIVSGTESTPVHANIINLLPETTYYYRIKCTISDGVVEQGSTLSFETPSPSIPLPFGNILPVSGRITEYQPFVLISQTQSEIYTNNPLAPPGAALLVLTNDNSVLAWSSPFHATPLVFVYYLVENKPIIRIYKENGMYLGIDDFTLTLSNIPSNIFTDNILFVNWYNVNIHQTVLNGQTDASPIAEGDNGILYDTSSDINPNIVVNYISPLPLENWSSTNQTQNVTETLSLWVETPTDYATSPGWNSLDSLFTNTLDSSVGWFGGNLVTCGTNWGLCEDNGFCIQSYEIFPGTDPLPSGKLPLKCNSTLFLSNQTPGDRGPQGEINDTPGEIGIMGDSGEEGSKGDLGSRGTQGDTGPPFKYSTVFTLSSLIFILSAIFVLILVILFILNFK